MLFFENILNIMYSSIFLFHSVVIDGTILCFSYFSFSFLFLVLFSFIIVAAVADIFFVVSTHEPDSLKPVVTGVECIHVNMYQGAK